jgi:peptidoglycan/LPS O-acetylase OafA/YrhL
MWRWLKPCTWLCVLATLAAYFAGATGQTEGFFSSMSAYLAASAFVWVVNADDRTWIVRLISAPLLRRIGLYSYGTYVLHDPLADVLNRVGILTMPTVGAGPAFVYCLVMVPVSILAGALSWHLIEKPILSLRAKMPYRGAARRRPQPPAPE